MQCETRSPATRPVADLAEQARGPRGTGSRVHPRDALLGAQAAMGVLPVCDHYSGVEARMVKSLQLQRELIEEFGTCVFDVTLDCEDGAPAGAEREQADLVCALANAASNEARRAACLAQPRVGVRLHAVDHPAFASDVEQIIGGAATVLSYVMIPKVESVAEVEKAVHAMDAVCQGTLRPNAIPLHVLIESPAAVHQAFAIAAHPRVQSISFGLMDFVSAHGGAIPSSAMGVRSATDTTRLDQFHHPLVVRAKLEVASACHAFGKVPSHCVVTEFRDTQALLRSAKIAAEALGYLRMWSIHPSQIRPILEAFSPTRDEVDSALHIVLAGEMADWAPVAVDGKLHDRASYRYFWQVLERAYQTGCELPDAARDFFVVNRR
ncbi:MAG: CoA ester lyase [Rhodoferax sp.]|nr:CoA ester lyase [Rhodoferax sp.]